jgi:hypothetical protein
VKEPTCQELFAMADKELIAWARRRYNIYTRDEALALRIAKEMRHEKVKWRAMGCGHVIAVNIAELPL